ncbi:MAG: hypothetical protein DHS20C20_03730 [Ardenticatenaceae bacterium]|nr:MAG: hypothetical protein DHS20C20_03730 [Ardenticatenaceae bacterium]
MNVEQQLPQETAVSQPKNSLQTQTGHIDSSQGVAVGDGATAVHIDAMGNVGDVVTGTKISLIHQATPQASKFQIRTPPESYIARPQAEEALKALLTEAQDSLRIVHLFGLPGVGKTWLAQKVAKGLEDQFKDGLLWADLEQTKFRTAVRHFIEPFDQIINHNSLRSNSEYVAAMENAFGDKRILIVLDQIDDKRNGLKNWLPFNCPNCVILLISQQQSGSLDAQQAEYRLPPMTESEAVQLLSPLLEQLKNAQADDTLLNELASAFDYNPAALNWVLKDITNRQESLQDYLDALSTKKDRYAAGQKQLYNLETPYENLPPEGKKIFPFLSILHTAPWAAGDLYTISRKKSQLIETGLAQLERAGLVEKIQERNIGRKRPFYLYCTPPMVSNLARQKLVELGGEQLIGAMTVLQATDTMRKAEMVLRYVREAILKESWQDKTNHELLLQSIDNQFSNATQSTKNEGETSSDEDSSSIFAIPRDPLLDFFENLILGNKELAARWIRMLRATDFYMLRNQLEEMFDRSLTHEDWPLLRQFATNINVNTRWIVDKKIEDKEGHNWDDLCLVFPLLKKLEVKNIELINLVLKSPNIKMTHWRKCQFIAAKWLGAYLFSSTFDDIDMVGMEMPGSIVANCTFTDVDARYGDFRGTMFQKCVFSNVKFRGARFAKAQFIDCSFSKVDFRLTRLEDAYEKALFGQKNSEN